MTDKSSKCICWDVDCLGHADRTPSPEGERIVERFCERLADRLDCPAAMLVEKVEYALEWSGTALRPALSSEREALVGRPGPLYDEIVRLHDRYVLAQGEIEDPQAARNAERDARTCRVILNRLPALAKVEASNVGG